ncbi:hypothetical protein R1sor_024334 [Riccia sorocarpa]|uniref:Uncharacterized protein n=1 Tax=Riccia sorocarpa TaxID=122646 RepID=A0ABD3GQ88_9MARC
MLVKTNATVRIEAGYTNHNPGGYSEGDATRYTSSKKRVLVPSWTAQKVNFDAIEPEFVTIEWLSKGYTGDAIDGSGPYDYSTVTELKQTVRCWSRNDIWMFRSECSNAEVGAADGAAAAGGTAVGADGDDAEFDKSSGEEEEDHGQTPQHEPVEEDGEDEEDSPSRYEIREHFREPVQPAITEAQRIICFVMGGESSAPRTMAPLPSVQRAITLGPQQ